MARFDNTHSRLVAWLKVALPLAALAILSTLFLVSRSIDPSDAIPYADVDIEDRLREPRMTTPTYSGLTSDGAALTLTAAAAKPDTGQGAEIAGVRADLTTPDGAMTRFDAATVSFDQTARKVTLAGGVTIATSSGYQLAADSLTANLDRTGVESAGAVRAQGPLGDITAGQMQITAVADAPGRYVLVFKNGVKLVYRPPTP